MNRLDCARQAATAFQLPGVVIEVEAHGNGLIHDTFVVSTDAPGSRKRYILQRINQHVFANPTILMENIERVTSHLQRKVELSGRDPEREVISLMRTDAGKTWHEYDGQAWRMVRFVEGTEAIDRAPSVGQAHQIALAFGRFLDDLSDFPAEALHVILPGYRDTERYLDSLWHVLKRDPLNRAVDARAEIAFIKSKTDDAMRIQNLLRSGEIQLRVIHGDTKLSNVLLDAETGAGICVIDLDTIMPGLLLHDIGDCVREALVGSRTHRGPLQEGDLQVFEAIVAGFCSALSTRPVALEKANIVAGVKSITLELGARFLADFLSGDGYFKTAHSEENLHRARQHFQLLRTIETSETKLQTIIQRSVREV